MSRSAQIFQEGQTIAIQDGPLTGSGTVIATAITQATTAVASLFVRSVTTSVKVDIYTVAADGEVKIIDFPLITAPTASLLLKQAAATMSNIRIEITHTGDCDIALFLRGSNGGATSVTIIGPTTARAYAVTATASPAVIVPSTLTDRQGLILMNYGSGPTIFVGFSAAEATSGQGWPIGQGGTLAVDLASGEEIYAVTSSGTVDVRIMESGG